LSELLPQGTTWDKNTKTWGAEDGTRVDVSVYDGRIEIFVRIDVRQADAELVEGVASLADYCNAVFLSAEGDIIAPSQPALAQAIAHSAAAQFVLDPELYITELRDKPKPM